MIWGVRYDEPGLDKSLERDAGWFNLTRHIIEILCPNVKSNEVPPQMRLFTAGVMAKRHLHLDLRSSAGRDKLELGEAGEARGEGAMPEGRRGGQRAGFEAVFQLAGILLSYYFTTH
jgi:hypothetical protein